MKQKILELSQKYRAGLRKHLQANGKVSSTNELAAKLGREAVAMGLETLELAHIHEHAMALSPHAARKSRALKRAAKFFAEANVSIEETHRTARQTTVHLARLKESLSQRTQELAATNRQLQRGVLRRKIMEVTAEKTGKHHQKSLEESLQLQKRLRQLTHRVLAAQEDERKKISGELQDEIAQTLLGINVRLLSLKQEARSNSKGFKQEIASTQRLVVKSVKSVRRVAREFGSL